MHRVRPDGDGGGALAHEPQSTIFLLAQGPPEDNARFFLLFFKRGDLYDSGAYNMLHTAHAARSK